MPKSTGREASKKPITSQVSSWGKEWWRWLTSRERQAASQFLGCLSIAFFIVTAVVAVLYIMGRPQEASGVKDVHIFIIVASIFLWYFVFIFLLSFHPKTREWADRKFHFRDRTDLEEFKVKIENIETRLGNIEATLKAPAGKGNKKGKK